MIVASFISGHWYYAPIFIIPLILILKFYFYTHKEDSKKYDAWRKEFSKTHKYLGVTPYYEDEVWENKLTGEIIEL